MVCRTHKYADGGKVRASEFDGVVDKVKKFFHVGEDSTVTVDGKTRKVGKSKSLPTQVLGTGMAGNAAEALKKRRKEPE